MPRQPLVEIAELLVDGDTDGLVEPSPEGFIVTEKGRPFVRSISACFDAYLETSEARHSAGVSAETSHPPHAHVIPTLDRDQRGIDPACQFASTVSQGGHP